MNFAALFIDFENVFYAIDRGLPDEMETSDAVTRLLRKLQNEVQNTQPCQIIIRHAYADFERIEERAQGALYLSGVESHNVLGTEHKNAADMRMCIDVMETLYTRPEIDTFILVAGDRDYIPVLQHLQSRAKNVLVVAFKFTVSGDLVQIVGESRFLDALDYLPSDIRFDAKRAAAPAPKPVAVVAAPPPVRPASVRRFPNPIRIVNEDVRDALAIMLDHFGDKPEVWLNPFLHRLRNELPSLAEYERKQLIADLEQFGAGVIEKRQGDTGPFSVFVVNWDHPDVRELNRGED